jgi:GNAT superfamily N-acetyltransferase
LHAGVPPLHVVRLGDDVAAQDWQHVHNVIIPSDALSLDEVRERAQRNWLEVAYRDDVLVACSTVRPPAGNTAKAASTADTATVIVRVLPEARRQGIGAELYERSLGHARSLGASTIETIVWEPNVEGLRFAEQRGFVEVERYVPEDDDPPFITLRLATT